MFTLYNYIDATYISHCYESSRETALREVALEVHHRRTVRDTNTFTRDNFCKPFEQH